MYHKYWIHFHGLLISGMAFWFSYLRCDDSCKRETFLRTHSSSFRFLSVSSDCSPWDCLLPLPSCRSATKVNIPGVLVRHRVLCIWHVAHVGVRCGARSLALRHKSLIAFQKRDGHTYIHIYIYIQHLLPSLATLRDPMPRAKALGNEWYVVRASMSEPHIDEFAVNFP